MSNTSKTGPKDVTELYGIHPNSDIYIIGTGASLRVFPVDFFQNKITLGLNMAWKSIPVRYGITIHPELNIPEFMPGEQAHPEITWATKLSKARGTLTQEQLRHVEAHFYDFETNGKPNTRQAPAASDAGRMMEWVNTPTPGKLYLYGSIASTGVNLAANMGAKNIILVGCDNCTLGNNHHAHQQHTRWLNAAPEQRYREYYDALCEIRSALHQRHINVLSMNPFMGLGFIENDFTLLCQEQGHPLFLSGMDISPVTIPRWKRVARKLTKKALGRK